MSSQTGNGPLTEYTYDLAGNVLTKRVGDATTTFTYNNRGQLTRTDRNGTLFRNIYDNMGRLVREEAVQNGVVTMHSAFAFTDTGAMRFADTGSHAIWNYYDAQGRLTLQAETDGITRTFAYNAASNIIDERVYINGRRYYHNTYTFDIAQRMRTVTSGGQLQSTYNYNANGSRTSTTLSNGVTTDYTRNVAGLVTRVVNRRGATVLSQFDYIYYLDGNTHQVVETMSGVTRTITYTYDTARRLTREHDTGAGGGAITRAYTFDNRSNRTQMTVTGAETYTVTSTHDLNNRLLTETRTGSNPSTTTFTYDRNGNQLTRVGGGQTETRTYNALNQLVRTEQVGAQQVTFNANGGVFGLDGSTSITEARTSGEALGNLPSPTRVGYELVGWYTAPTGGTRITESTILPGASTTATYTYRADGLRHSKTVNGIVTTHVWSRGQIVIERNAAGAVINRYMRCLRGRLIRSDHHGFYLYNVRGDVVQRTDASGNVIAVYRYTAFGIELAPNASNTNRFRFGGMYWDAHRSEYMTPNRMFNPRRGRWTSPDPFFHMRFGQARMMGSSNSIAQAGNLYVFTMNNPVRWIDPTGLFAQGPTPIPWLPRGSTGRANSTTSSSSSSFGWNEADDHWFNLFSAVSNAGGTSSFDANTRTASVNIWGVNVAFGAGSEGVRIGMGGVFQVRADTFYSSVVNAAGGEMAFLGGHNANIPGFNAYHMHIAIFAAYGTDVYSRLLEEGPDSTRWGLRYGFISGTAGGFSRARGGVNLDTYMTRANRQFFNHIASGAGTGTDLFSGLDHFLANHSNAFPWNGRWTNSTSFTIGLVSAMGHQHGLSSTQIANSWGINNAFAARYFGR